MCETAGKMGLERFPNLSNWKEVYLGHQPWEARTDWAFRGWRGGGESEVLIRDKCEPWSEGRRMAVGVTVGWYCSWKWGQTKGELSLMLSSNECQLTYIPNLSSTPSQTHSLLPSISPNANFFIKMGFYSAIQIYCLTFHEITLYP